MGETGDIYEQGGVKTVAGFFRGNATHLFGVARGIEGVRYIFRVVRWGGSRESRRDARQ